MLKDCEKDDKGWFFVYEAVGYESSTVTGSRPGGSPGYTIYTFGAVPTLESYKLPLDDLDPLSVWILGEPRVIGTTEQGSLYPGYNFTGMYASNGKKQILVFRQNRGFYNATSPMAVNGVVQINEFPPSVLTNYKFIYCGEDCCCCPQPKTLPAILESKLKFSLV